MNNLLKFDNEYSDWIENISRKYRHSQIKASVKVNDEMLRFYWSLGRDMEKIKDAYAWGSHFYEQISTDLKKKLPEVNSFSPRNLLYMHQYYRLFPEAEIPPQLGAQFSVTEFTPQPDAEIYLIPWGHIKLLIDKCRNDRERTLFYIRKTIENNWSRSVLLNIFDSDLYERQGKAITNFAMTLPKEQSDLAQAMTRDPYQFDFLTIREKYDEKELKDALVDKVESFLMELGTGFAFMGREVRLEVGNTEKFIDLLFYHTKQHCYVVVEVKSTEFDSAFAGQLGTYVVAVNHQLKSESDNPTIGLLICKGMDKVEVQYALESTSQPFGVSTYELSKLIPEEFKGSMPTIEEIEAELADPKGGQDA